MSTINFNLRVPNGKRSTNIYAVVYDGIQQRKISIGLKCYPFQWDSKKQLPIISNEFSKIEQERLLSLLQAITNVRLAFYSSESIDDFLNKVNTMAVSKEFLETPRTPKASKAINKAYSQYLKDKKPKESSVKVYERIIKKFLKWIKSGKVDSFKVLKQDRINAYKQHLIDSGITPKTINSEMRFLVAVINGYIVPIEKYNIKTLKVISMKVENNSDEDSNRVILLDKEIELLMNYEDSSHKRFAVLMLKTGLRHSDAYHLARGENIISDDKEKIFVRTKKRNKKACVVCSRVITETLQYFKDNPITQREDNHINYFNKYLKSTFKKLNIVRLQEYKDGHGIVHKKKVCDLITSHSFRHTFVTRKVIEEFNADKIGFMIGDTAAMVEQTYVHLKDDEIFKMIVQEREKIKNQSNANNLSNDERKSEEQELSEVLTYLGYDYIDICDLSRTDKWRKIVDKEHELLNNYKMECDKVKEIFRHEDLPLKERKKLLDDIIQSFKR